MSFEGLKDATPSLQVEINFNMQRLKRKKPQCVEGTFAAR